MAIIAPESSARNKVSLKTIGPFEGRESMCVKCTCHVDGWVARLDDLHHSSL